MRPLNLSTVLCLGTTIIHTGFANNFSSSRQSMDLDGVGSGTGSYRSTPQGIRHEEGNYHPVVPEIPNEKSHCYNDAFYLDDFEVRNIAVRASAEIQIGSRPYFILAHAIAPTTTENDIPAIDDTQEVECTGTSDNEFDTGDLFDFVPKVRCKRAGFKLEEPKTPILPAATEDPAIVDVSKEMAISEIGTLGDKTKAGLIPKICKSREFQPTLENYWVSGTDKFLRDHSRENQGFSNYQRDGLLKSLAKKHLGDNTGVDCSFRDGVFSFRRCKITCSEVLKNVNDVALARKVYFSLAAAAGFSEVMGIMHDSFAQIPERLTSMISQLPEVERTLAALNGQDMLHSEAQFFSEALRHAVVASALWHPVEKVSERADANRARARSDYDSAAQVYAMIEGGDDPYKWDKLFDPSYEMSISDLDLPRSDAPDHVSEASPASTEGWHGKTVERTKNILVDCETLIRSIESGELGRARESGYSVLEGLFNRIRDTMDAQMNILAAEVPGEVTTRSRKAIEEVLHEILMGNDVDSDGSTNLSRLLSYGNYLPLGAKQAISKFKNANPVEKLTKNIFMRLFDLSFDGNKFYISCTRDMQRRDNPREDIPGVTSPCDRDNSGPQNLKACVADHVCYMYRWSERNFDYLSHNKEPKGMDKWDEPPFNITAEDIITSSVLSKLQGIERGESGDSLSNILKSTKGGLSSLSDPRNPGVFHIPICFSRQNWNTQVTGWNTFCDTDPHCPAKNFPCFCGSWGKETESVWRGMGVGQDNKRRNYVQHLCPRQISRKVADPLERYMAYCALDIRRNTCGTRVNGLTKYAGKDKYCQLFESVMEHKGFESIMDMDPEIKFAFTCKIKKGGKGCSMYDNMFEGLWMDAIDEGFLRFEDKPKNLP